MPRRVHVHELTELYDESRLKYLRASDAYKGMDTTAQQAIDAIIRESKTPGPDVSAPPGTVARNVKYFRHSHTTMRNGRDRASELTGRAWAAAKGAYQV
jgi:hypothetical protein